MVTGQQRIAGCFAPTPVATSTPLPAPHPTDASTLAATAKRNLTCGRNQIGGSGRLEPNAYNRQTRSGRVGWHWVHGHDGAWPSKTRAGTTELGPPKLVLVPRSVALLQIARKHARIAGTLHGARHSHPLHHWAAGVCSSCFGSSLLFSSSMYLPSTLRISCGRNGTPRWINTVV